MLLDVGCHLKNVEIAGLPALLARVHSTRSTSGLPVNSLADLPLRPSWTSEWPCKTS